MRTPFDRGLLSLLLALAFLAGTFACNVNKIDINDPTPATPTPVPTPTPTPTPASPASDVAGMVVLVYGYDCPSVPQPSHGDGVIVAGCNSAAVTATPKNAKGDDAVNHGSQIAWSVAVSPAGSAIVEPGEENPLFNRVVRVTSPRQAATVTLTATLVDPDRRVWTASKTVRVAL